MNFMTSKTSDTAETDQQTPKRVDQKPGRRIHRGRRHCVIAAGAVCLLIALAVTGCNPTSSGQPQRQAPMVTVAKPVTKKIVEWDAYTGRLEPVQFVEVRARVSGYLQSIHFREGQIVEVGDLLFVIDRRPFEAALERAIASRDEAKAQVSKAMAGLDQAKAQRQKADVNLVLTERRFGRAKTLRA